jgi:predicted alpha/beta-fold hydrolase
LKYLGEQGDSTLNPIKAAVTISVPCDLKGCSVRLEEFGNRLYPEFCVGVLECPIAF